MDVRATVAATVRNAGWFMPVSGRSLLIPEYLILIDRASQRDHQARFFDEFIARLSKDEVIIARYEFDRDPRICQAASTLADRVTIPVLATRHPDHRLLIISNGAGLINPLTGEVAAWAEQFARWNERVLLTPEAPEHWGYRELALARQGLLVLPMTEEGLAALPADPGRAVNQESIPSARSSPPFPASLRDRPRRWLQQLEPERDALDGMLTALRVYLGQDGYLWLAACAVYPALHWELTLHLGCCLRTATGSRLLEPNRLAALARLPWFRYGSMPDWLRAALIRSLPREQEQSIRDVLQTLLLTETGGAAQTFDLEIARARRHILRPLATHVFRALRLRAPDDSPVRDFVFASYMTGRRINPLSLELPKAMAGVIDLRSRRGSLILSGALALAIAGVFTLVSRIPVATSNNDGKVEPLEKSGQVSSKVSNGAPVAQETKATTPLGASGCGTVACHGAQFPAPSTAEDRIRADEFTVWKYEDSHSRSYDSLFSERAQSIVRWISTDQAPSTTAQEDVRCLACHTMPRPKSLLAETAQMNSDGVGCESCHGNAAEWLVPHSTSSWRELTSQQKEARGFRAIENLLRRAEVCVGCHVGSPSHEGLPRREINHELIRAGHPALRFEFSIFLDNMPPHWDEKGENAGPVGPNHRAKDFPARVWAIGRLVAFDAALKLLQDRAREADSPRVRWPEFAEYSCFSCHHDLRDQAWRRVPRAGASIGTPLWGSWTTPLASELIDQLVGGSASRTFAESLGQLAVGMGRVVPDSVVAVKRANDVSRSLSRCLAVLATKRFDAGEVERLIERLDRPDAWRRIASWDEAVQRYLALQSLWKAWTLLDPQKQNGQEWLKGRLIDLEQRLVLGAGFNSPSGFDPAKLLVNP
jgi:hypothetical protein